MTGKVSGSFDLLDLRLRRWVYKKGWAELRDIQEMAIPVILTGDRDVIISATTAAGKTEAAFLPVCSAMAGEGDAARPVALVASPLKALINDQFRRLEEMCAAVDLPVHRWHGDVAANHKAEFLRNPHGLLLITPESMEALFVNRGHAVKQLFKNLRYVVVDELHAFIGRERGRQLQSLLHRIDVVIDRTVPRIGLSATLGDMRLAAEALRPGKDEAAAIIESGESSRDLLIQVRGYVRQKIDLGEETLKRKLDAGQEVSLNDIAGGDVLAIARHIYANLRGSDNLVFINAKRFVEEYADLLRRLSEESFVPNEFFPHHGSLSKELREEAEARLKDPAEPTTVVCTNTLELGIDVGNVKSIAQIGPPPSVASLRQRLGRSGRRQGDPSILRLYCQEEEITPKSDLDVRLRLDLFQSVGTIELLIEKWCEPPAPEWLHLSTLIQQLLSGISQYGGLRPDNAYGLLCEGGPFSDITPRHFMELLRDLGEREILLQAREGLLMHGRIGEKIVNHYAFYAAFATPEEYRLEHKGRTIGSIPIDYPLAEDQYIIFAGRRWRVVAIDNERKVISLEPHQGGRPPLFGGVGFMVHGRIRTKMKELYIEGEPPKYLDAGARKLFKEGAETFRARELKHNEVIGEGGGWLLLPWTGDEVVATLALLLIRHGLKASADRIFVRVDRAEKNALREALHATVNDDGVAPEELAAMSLFKNNGKFGSYLGERLKNLDFASRTIRLHDARLVAARLLRSPVFLG